jgi:hypothetical protein
MFPRKDYAAIAQQIRYALGDGADDRYSLGVAHAARNVADALKASNPRFRYDVFFAACGLDSFGYPTKEGS